MGSLTCEAVEAATDIELVGRFAPGRGFDDPAGLGRAEVVVEFGPPAAVIGNASAWRLQGSHLVVGSSGFPHDELVRIWGTGPPNCLVAPNFSLGAVVMTAMAVKVAPFFAAAEIIEGHHDRKVDAPSGTARATAGRMRPSGKRAVESTESTPGARGAEIGEVWVHSVRLPGLLAHHQVLFGNQGEVLTIRHDTTDRTAFVPGILLAIRSVAGLPPGVTLGLERLLGF
jgi:4-hydroxy-tetrahydrodipicolinate reductase